MQTASANPYGVLDFLHWDHDWNQNHYSPSRVAQAAKLMAEAGIGTVRVDFLWSDLEPRPGQFDYSRYDRLVETLTGQGLEILGVLQYNPSWRPGPWNQAPDPACYEAYVRNVVRQ